MSSRYKINIKLYVHIHEIELSQTISAVHHKDGFCKCSFTAHNHSFLYLHNKPETKSSQVVVKETNII